MFKVSLFAVLLTISTAVSARANSVCYMEMSGQQIDLSHMCGNGSSSVPLPEPDAIIPEYTEYTEYTDYENTQQVEIPVVEDDPVTFQVTRVQYHRDTDETTIVGLVVFPRTAEHGAMARPSVYDQRNGVRVTGMPSVMRTRGQRRLTVSEKIPGKFFLRNLEGKIDWESQPY